MKLTLAIMECYVMFDGLILMKEGFIHPKFRLYDLYNNLASESRK